MKRILFTWFSLVVFFWAATAYAAPTVTFPAAVFNTSTNASAYDGNAFTCTAGSVEVAVVTIAQTTTLGTFTGGGFTWSLVDNDVINGLHYIAMYQTVCTSATSITPHVGSVTGAAGATIAVWEVAGADTSNPIAQHKAAHGSGVSPAVTFASNLSTNNAYIAGVGNQQNPAGVGAAASWTEDYDVGYTSPFVGNEGARRSGGETGTTITFSQTSGSWAMVAAEIAVATATPTPTSTPTITPTPTATATATATNTPGPVTRHNLPKCGAGL